MSIDSDPEPLPKNYRRPNRNVEAAISPGLREQIIQAAQKIRGDHGAELADGLKADGAVRLFRSIIHPDGKEAGSFQKTSGASAASGEDLGSLAGELGALLGDAIRAQTGLLAAPLTVLARGWMETVLGPQSLATPQMPGAAAPEIPAASPAAVKLGGILRQFMPMLMSSLNQGRDGYGLAKTVIAMFGRPTYDQVSGIGADQIMKMVKAEPDLWAQVAPVEAKFSRFLDEFMGYDAWLKEQAH